MSALLQKAGARGLRLSGASGRHIYPALGSISTSKVHLDIHTSTGLPTAWSAPSTYDLLVNPRCGEANSASPNVVRRTPTHARRWSKDANHSSIRTQLARQYSSAAPTRLASVPAWSWRSLSTSSSDKASKNPEGEGLGGGGDAEGVPVAEAEVSEKVGATQEEPRHSHIEMPSITDVERVANLTSWSVKVGDTVEAGDVVCEIELEQYSVGVKVETFGFLAEILVEAGTEKVPVGTPLATIVHSKEDIALFQEAQETRAPAEKEPEKDDSQATDGFSWKDVLKAVLRLRQEEKLSEDFSSTLMSLARNKDADLLQAFEGCYDGDVYKGDIDDELFVVQAIDIAKTRRKYEGKS